MGILSLFENERLHDRMDNDLTNPKRLQDVASDSKCPVKLSLSVSSSNAVSVPGWIWIWHPAWRTRYWFTRTTDSGILSVVLGQFFGVSLARKSSGRFNFVITQFLSLPENDYILLEFWRKFSDKDLLFNFDSYLLDYVLLEFWEIFF